MTTSRAVRAWGLPEGMTEAGRGWSRDLDRALGRDRVGLGWKIAGLAAVALVVAAGVSLWPDFLRYMRIRNM
jgi:hypothetical protein